MPTFSTRTPPPVLRLAARLHPRTDADALDRFTRYRDQDAFAHLVRRYGPLVAGVCRRVLGLRPEADDAVQATFWALARQAGSIRDARTLPAWFHAVAYRAARKAAARATPPPSPAPVPAAPDDPFAEAAWREVRQLLDEEVRRLPERLRLPILLCYFEELTRDEAADRLGWSLSTVKRRLDLARDRLKNRLRRRGVEPRLLGAVGLLAGGLTARVAPALEAACSHLLHEPPAAAVRLLAAAPVVGRWAWATAVLVLLGGSLAFLGGQGPAAKPPAGEPKPAAEVVVNEPLPPGALARFGTTRYRSSSGFWFGSFSRDGRWFVSGTDGVELWDLQTGVPRQLCPIRNNTVPRPVLSPDGTLVANLDGGPGVHLLDAKTGKELRAVGGLRKFDEIAFAADGKRLVATTHSGSPFATGYDVATGAEIFFHQFPASMTHRLGVWKDRVVFFLLDGGPPAGEPAPLKVRIADVETGKDLRTFETGVTDYQDPRRAPGGGFRMNDGGPFGGYQFALSELAGLFAYVRADDQLALVPLTEGAKARAVELPAEGSAGRPFHPGRFWFAPDGKSLFVAEYSGTIARCDTATGKLLAAVPGHREGVDCWHFDPAGDRLTTAGRDKHIRRWDLKTNREIPLAPGYATDVRAVFSPDGTRVVVGDRAGAIDVYEAKTGKLVRALPRPAGSADWCTFALTPDGRTLVATRPDGTMLWWDLIAGKELAATAIPGPKPDQVFHAVECLVFSADGTRLACGRPSGELSVLDTATRAEIWRVGLPADPAGVDYAKGLSLAPDGTRVARALRHWDKPAGRLAFSVQVLDARTGAPVKAGLVFDGQYGKDPVGEVVDVRYTPDGRYLAVLVRNGRVLLLDPDSLAEVATWTTETKDGFAFNVSPDGRTLLTGGDAETTKLWEVATGKAVGSVPGHRGYLATAAVSPDGRFLLTGGYDHVAYLWSLAPAGPAAAGDALDRLRGDDAAAARRAVWALAADPRGPALVRAAVKPVAGPPAEAIRGWVADLDHAAFAKREAAAADLIRAGRFAEPAVRAALAGRPTPEARERLEKVLAGLPRRPTAEEVFQARAVHAMELAGGAAARQLLREWAAGPPGAWLTTDARAALGRGEKK